MKRAFLVACGALAVVAACRGAMEPVDMTNGVISETVGFYSYVLGHSWAATIDSASLSSEPAWSGPGTVPPPLAMDMAVEISRHELVKYGSKAQAWKVARASLYSVCCPEKWFYVIGWLPPGSSGEPLEIPVLLSGKAVELVRHPENESEETH